MCTKKRLDTITGPTVAQRVGNSGPRRARARPSAGGAARRRTRPPGGSADGDAAYWVRAPSGDDAGDDDDELEEPMFQMSLTKYKPVRMSLLVENKNLEMEIDTGSAFINK